MTTFCLEVMNGRFAGSTAVLHPGDVCRIGSRAGSELWLSDDPHIEPAHCAIAADRTGLRVHDLSQSGTYVNGKRVTRSLLRHGDWIAAGTSIVFTFKDGDPEDGFETVTSTLAQSLNTWSQPRWYLGLAAQGSFARRLLEQLGDECIAIGNAGVVAARLPRNWDRLRSFLRAVWGEGSGIFFESPETIEVVAGHFNAIHKQRPTGRYFDPRVLRVVLPEMTAEAVREAMGPAAGSFLLESQLPGTAFLFGWSNESLSAVQLRLSKMRPLLPTQDEIANLLRLGGAPNQVFSALVSHLGAETADFVACQHKSHPYALSRPEARVQFAVLEAVLRDGFLGQEVDALLRSRMVSADSALDAYVGRLNARRG